MSRCEERSRAWLRSPDGGGLPSLAAEEAAIESCGKWVDWDFGQAIGWIIQLSLGCITAAHWTLDLFSMRMHAQAIARQQRLWLLPSPCPKLPETLSVLVVLAVGGGVATLWTFWDLGML